MNLRAILTIAAVVGMGVLLFLPADLRAAEPIELDAIGTTCLETPLKDCKVLTAGYLNVAEFGEDDGQPYLAWQTQLGFTDTDGTIGGFVLFQYDSGRWSLLDSGFDGYFEIPRLKGTLLHVPGYGQGTAAFNTDRLYRWGDLGHAVRREGWIAVDTDGWFGAVDDLLPPGLEIWKGVDYDFEDWFYGNLSANTPLWRADDANCCPSGGQATIRLAIRDNQLVATGVDYLPPAKSK